MDYIKADVYFSIVPEWVIDAPISAQAVRVYAVLCRYADKDTGTCFPSIKTLADRINVSESTIKRALKELKSIGASKSQKRFDSVTGEKTSNLYTVMRSQGVIYEQPYVKDDTSPSSSETYKPESINQSHSLEDRKVLWNVLVEAMGYQEGGATDMMQDPVTQNVIMFILGETDDENAINAFVEKYGAEQFMFLRDKILKQAAGNPDAQTEGLIEGMGNSGMADDLPMNIGDKPIAAVSQDEYIVPADVVSMLGDGSSDAGSKRLDGMLDRVRMAKTGDKTQAPPLNPNKVLPA